MKIRRAPEAAPGALVQGGIIVVVQIVESHDLLTAAEQRLTNMIADEPGGAGHEYGHEFFSRANSSPGISEPLVRLKAERAPDVPPKTDSKC